MSSNKSKKRKVSLGIVHVKCGFNNTIISISDLDGNILCWSSSGKEKFRGPQKGTPYAAEKAAKNLAEKAITDFAMTTVSVVTWGIGNGREAAVKGISLGGIVVKDIKDITSVPHGGCRPQGRRRV